MLLQTKRAIAAMKSQGFRWPQDFSARTGFDRKVMGYTEARVILWTHEARQKAIEKAEALAATEDLDIILYEFKDSIASISIQSGTGRLVRYRW